MSVAIANVNGRKAKVRKWYAGFIGEKQVTRWYLSVDKAWKVARLAKAKAIGTRWFIEPPAEGAAAT